ncbi:hypothetical protein NEIRO03_2497 [Nematocida sp. AWRm78]|nr:hypothetical protein NEIRO02_2482 [Nematocida sp. AWRm79]KAI5187285.1 hypothetical protein NEIRO03_2497 [Nematocida sp. AWRm78]
MKLSDHTIRAIIGVSLVAVGLLCIFIPVIITIIRVKCGYAQVSTVEMVDISNYTTSHNLLHNDHKEPVFTTHSSISNHNESVFNTHSSISNHNEPAYNDTVSESDEHPYTINNRRDNLFIIFIRTFNTYYNKLLLVAGLITLMFGSLILLSNKKKEERFFCGTITNDTLRNKLRNNEHSVINYDQSHLKPRSLQMPQPDEFSADPFDIPRTSYDYNEYSYDYRHKRELSQQNPIKPEKCMPRSEWDKIIAAHDEKYANAGIAIDLAQPDNLCSFYD